MSTEEKAKRLAKDGVAKIDNDLYQVKGSKPDTFYIVHKGECECLGYKFKSTCSHIRAIQIFEELQIAQDDP